MCVGVSVRHKCVMSPWLFNIYMDGFIKAVKARDFGCETRVKGIEKSVADDTLLLAES